MEEKRKGLSRREFLKAAGVVVGALGFEKIRQQLTPKPTPSIENAPPPTQPLDKVTETPAETTGTPFQPEPSPTVKNSHDEEATPTSSPTEAPKPEEVKKEPPKEPLIGSVDLRKPFKMEVSENLARIAGFGRERIEEVNKSQVINAPELTEQQIRFLTDYANHPGAAIVARTDNDKVNHWLVAGHSGVNLGRILPFDVFRRAYLANPEGIVGESITLEQNGKKAKIEFVHATHVNAEQFKNAFVNYKGSQDEERRNLPAFYWLERLGIPYFEEDGDLVTIAGCLDTLPGDVRRDAQGNPILDAIGNFIGASYNLTYNRFLLTAKVVNKNK